MYNLTDDGSPEVLERGTSRLTSSTVSKTTSRSGRAKKRCVYTCTFYIHLFIDMYVVEVPERGNTVLKAANSLASVAGTVQLFIYH